MCHMTLWYWVLPMCFTNAVDDPYLSTGRWLVLLPLTDREVEKAQKG